MYMYFAIIFILFIQGFIFGINLESIDFYRSLEKKELLRVLYLLDRDKYFTKNNELFTYIDLAKQALIERGVKILSGSDKSDNVQNISDLKHLKNCNNAKFISKASEALNIFIYCDDNDGFLKTLDGRNIGIQDGNFVILNSLPFKGYDGISRGHSTIEIYNASILYPDFSKFLLDKSGSFVYVEEFNKRVYFNDISKLSKEELLFLFYELFPVSRLKGVKDWYDFGFSSILKEVKKAYNIEMNLNARKMK
ncbi:hypothetical protein BmHoA_00545 [Borrelia miyamotoi]|nr:hypothetical protein [Borrelia miyamotoi]AHH04877.1 Hypothetical protein BOM_0334 [Borrelia miyamotoi FR64b]AHH05616.1 Hypothetical protein BOM_1073 [Borrelia miyamotoi FR64b]BCR19481.1 hypothetical protein BmHoA_00545 [Borrelia miyamotoi]BCR20314.1 hypothetical protein BmHoB_00546 [Borrelia miyamotoi]